MGPEQLRTFEQRGVVRLGGAVPPGQLRHLHERLFAELERQGIAPSGRGLPPSVARLPAFQQVARLSSSLAIPDLAAKVITPFVQDAVEACAGRKVSMAQSQLLVSPPRQGSWRLDGLNWHTDVTSPAERLTGVQVFVLLDDIASQGGATLALAGSQLRRHDERAETELRQALRAGSAGEAELAQRGLSIVELSGQIGDVYVMDMRVLHTPSINTSARFRLVATVRYFVD